MLKRYQHWEKLNKQKKICLLILALILSALPGLADTRPVSGCITNFEGGQIDWQTGRIIAYGRAAPKDMSKADIDSLPGAARAEASHRIIRMLKKVRIESGRSVGDYAAQNDIILAGIEKTARDAVVSKQTYTSALSVELRLEASMRGGFLQLVLPEEIRQIPKISMLGAAGAPALKTGRTFTGLVIDVRGLDVTPVLNPYIVSEQGEAVYTPQFISREFAVQNGVCRYACSMETALKDDRIGSTPLVFKGLRKEGKLNTVVVISMSDYHLLEKVEARHQFFRECRVVLVID